MQLLAAAIDAAAVPLSAALAAILPGALDLSCPFLVTDPELELAAEEPDVKSALPGLCASWQTSDLRLSLGRVLQKLVPDSVGATSAAHALSKCQSLALPLPASDDAAQLLASLAPAFS